MSLSSRYTIQTLGVGRMRGSFSTSSWKPSVASFTAGGVRPYRFA